MLGGFSCTLHTHTHPIQLFCLLGRAFWFKFQSPFLTAGKLRMIRRWRLTEKPKQAIRDGGRKGQD